MPAGWLDESYVGRMQSLDWVELYQSHNLGQFVEELRDQWKSGFDFVLFVLTDSRTGVTDIGGICTVQLPDFLVLLFTANYQNIDGAYHVIQLARRQRNALPFDRAKLLVLPVVTRFEGRVEYEMAQEWLGIIENKLEPLYADWQYHTLKPADLLNFTRIPYIPYWSFGERIPVLEEDTKDPESAGYALETLAAMLAHKLSDTDTLVSNRDSLAANAKLGPARSRGVSRENLEPSSRAVISLFLSYSHKDEGLAKELMQHLNSLQRQGVINVFDDRRIVSGSEWANEISLALEQAQIILLLISADFLASDYAYGVETGRALGRHQGGDATVLPVMVRPVDISGSPFATLSLLPSDGRPVSTWPNRDEAWVKVIQGIRRAVSQTQMSQSQVLI